MLAFGSVDTCNHVSDLVEEKTPENFDPYYMPSNKPGNSSFYYFLNDKEVQQSINVDKHFSSCNGTVGEEFWPQDYWVDSRQFIVPMIEAGVKTLIFDGDLDWICNYYQEEKVVDEMQWSGQAFWKKIEFSTCPEGLCKQYRNLRYIRFAGAGHMVPSFKP